MVSIHLTETEVQAAKRLAIARYEANKNNPNAHYANSLRGHFVGVMGEMAVHRYLGNIGLFSKPQFAVTDNDCDIRLENWRIEVKTWRRQDWPALGRALNTTQYARMLKHMDNTRVVWCTMECPPKMEDYNYDQYEGIVILQGWNRLRDLEKGRPISHNGLESVQLSHLALRPMTTFNANGVVS